MSKFAGSESGLSFFSTSFLVFLVACPDLAGRAVIRGSFVSVIREIDEAIYVELQEM